MLIISERGPSLYVQIWSLQILTYKNTVQAPKHPSADAVTQSGHKSDTTASNIKLK